MTVRDVHSTSLATSTALSSYYVADLITPLDVLSALAEVGVRAVLVGAHGLGGWLRKPRATEDVDVIVGARNQKKAVRTLLTAFPLLEADDHEVVTRLRDKETKIVRIDVMKTNQPLFQAVLKNTSTVEAKGLSYQIPSLEMALALKFAPMISLNRSEEKKYIDAHDFITIVKSNATIDVTKLAELGQLVYNGGGAEIVELVRKVRAGEKLVL